jgi:hypothetical protein
MCLFQGEVKQRELALVINENTIQESNGFCATLLLETAPPLSLSLSLSLSLTHSLALPGIDVGTIFT